MAMVGHRSARGGVQPTIYHMNFAAVTRPALSPAYTPQPTDGPYVGGRATSDDHTGRHPTALDANLYVRGGPLIVLTTEGYKAMQLCIPRIAPAFAGLDCLPSRFVFACKDERDGRKEDDYDHADTRPFHINTTFVGTIASMVSPVTHGVSNVGVVLAGVSPIMTAGEEVVHADEEVVLDAPGPREIAGNEGSRRESGRDNNFVLPVYRNFSTLMRRWLMAGVPEKMEKDKIQTTRVNIVGRAFKPLVHGDGFGAITINNRSVYVTPSDIRAVGARGLNEDERDAIKRGKIQQHDRHESRTWASMYSSEEVQPAKRVHTMAQEPPSGRKQASGEPGDNDSDDDDSLI
jgi:hypothetical protein